MGHSAQEVADLAEPVDQSFGVGDRYRRLPDPVRLEDTISSQESRPTQDPYAGRDTELDFVLRAAG